MDKGSEVLKPKSEAHTPHSRSEEFMPKSPGPSSNTSSRQPGKGQLLLPSPSLLTETSKSRCAYLTTTNLSSSQYIRVACGRCPVRAWEMGKWMGE